jgi:hypothetical protein
MQQRVLHLWRPQLFILLHGLSQMKSPTPSSFWQSTRVLPRPQRHRTRRDFSQRGHGPS